MSNPTAAGNPWAAAAAQAQRAAADAAARVTPATVISPRVPVEQCPGHPGVKWGGLRPCFICYPEAWDDAPWQQTAPPAPPTGWPSNRLGLASWSQLLRLLGWWDDTVSQAEFEARLDAWNAKQSLDTSAPAE